jgi:transglutaminase-like putative cysteine protease
MLLLPAATNFNLTIVFATNIEDAPYSVTIRAWVSTTEAISVPIYLDGKETGFYTPYTFTGLVGTHSFTLPYQSPDGKPFAVWACNESLTTLTVSKGGTYDAWYDLCVPRRPWPAEYRFYITPDDPAVKKVADNKTWGQLLNWVSSHVYYHNFTDNWSFPNETIASGVGVCREYATLYTSLLLARGYHAYVATGMLNEKGKEGAHAWTVLELEGVYYTIEPQCSWVDQALTDFSKYAVEYYANQTGVYLPESYQLIPPPAPDLVTTVNYYLGMITEPVGTWLENNIGSAVPSIIPLVDYLFIQMPIVLVILIVAFFVVIRVIWFLLKHRREKSKKRELPAILNQIPPNAEK